MGTTLPNLGGSQALHGGVSWSEGSANSGYVTLARGIG